MNEVMQRGPRKIVRHRLLLTVSSSAILAFAGEAYAKDADHPTVWIELGGAFDQISRDAVGWVPPNLTNPISNPSPKPFGKTPAIGYDFDAAITIAPEDSDWVYTAAIRYGRAQRGPKHTHDQSYDLKKNAFGGKYSLTTYAFLNATERTGSTHAVIDFNVGRDVGLGAFQGGKSTIHFGIRVAQLNERAEATLTAFSTQPAKYSSGKLVHEADALIARSYTGAGPSASWDGAAPLIGSLNDGLTFDWGANAAVLFGRQKSRITLHTKDTQYYGYGVHQVLSQSTDAPMRDKTVVVPNVGGFAGLSWRLDTGKISFGYRADFFFGAIDGGIDARKTYDRSFYGPFASVSIGLGN